MEYELANVATWRKSNKSMDENEKIKTSAKLRVGCIYTVLDGYRRRLFLSGAMPVIKKDGEYIENEIWE